MKTKIKICTPGASLEDINISRRVISDALAGSGIDYDHVWRIGALVFDNRNRCILDNSGIDSYTHILQWDSDIIATAEDVKKLLSHNLPIVSGAARHRQVINCFAASPDGESFLGNDKRGLNKVLWAGAAFLLIQRDVLKNLPRPWFRHVPNGETQTGEDVGFCLLAGQYGYSIFVDCDVRVEHLTNRSELRRRIMSSAKENERVSETSVEAVECQIMRLVSELQRQIYYYSDEVRRLLVENERLKKLIKS